MPLETTQHAHGNNPDHADHADHASQVLPPLSQRESERLVQLALSTTAGLGLALTYQGGSTLVAADPSDNQVLGLSNLARVLAGHPESFWPDLVTEHFTDLLDKLDKGSAPLPDDPRRELVQRLVPRVSLPPDWSIDRPEFVPGLLSVPATAADGIITMYLKASDLGISWDQAEAYGLANLRRLTDHVEFFDHDEFRLAAITGSPFAASRALVLDTVLRESLQVEHAPHGVLAAVPARDALILHVIKDLSVIPALGLMLNVAGRCYSHDPGPLSPEVYLVTPDLDWLPATTVLPDHTPLRMSPVLESLTKQLADHELKKDAPSNKCVNDPEV
ncbi:hypothetical protein PWY87_18380 [Kribbella solani]|uniref:hypothetical protein n=1 Tax=Kribbella solani TaxID=236067 RepID=UPI0029ADEEA3|nr:hypothetical protein [Kribbella solani]MDX3003661.1 hypothetical protein [Kribbella solani]